MISHFNYFNYYSNLDLIVLVRNVEQRWYGLSIVNIDNIMFFNGQYFNTILFIQTLGGSLDNSYFFEGVKELASVSNSCLQVEFFTLTQSCQCWHQKFLQQQKCYLHVQ